MFLENWTYAIHKKCGKKKFWFVKVLICNQVYNKKHLDTLCAFLFNFLFSGSTIRFIAYISLCAKYVIKASQKKNMKNCLFKMKDWIKLFLKKGSLLQWKSIFVWSKRHLRLSRRARGDWIPPNSGPILGLKSVWVLDVALPFVNLKKE